MPPPPDDPAGRPPARPDPLADRPLTALFLISALGLFAELLLIRWVATEVRVFAYLQNTVLVVCFLGLGMGCRDAARGFALRDMLLPLGAVTAVLAVPVVRAEVGGWATAGLAGFGDLFVWGRQPSRGAELAAKAGVGLTLSFLLLALVWDVFVPVGRLLGRLLAASRRPLAAYSANVAGSLAGILLFAGCGAAALPPVGWAAVLAALAAPFAGSGGRSRAADLGLLAGLAAVAGLAGWDPGWGEVHWSPYQKLMVRAGPPDRRAGDIGVCQVSVNNTDYQEIVDLRPEVVAADPAAFPPDLRGLGQYDLPARLHPAPRRVLVVGAGSGNDVAGALRGGAERVVAVEIDPVIVGVGRRFHPERPYADRRVEVVVDDARSYFATCREEFDLIVFGLLDAHTAGSALTNARLDHYVYTRESLDRARRLLAPGGVMALGFYALRPFIVDRMADTLGGVFGHPPRVFRVPPSGYGRGGVLFVTAADPAVVDRRLAADRRAAEFVARQAVPTAPGRVPVATDDWPYLYLEHPRVPVMYGLLAGVLGLLYARGAARLGPAAGGRWGRPGWHFFFLGAAFLLLEVQNVSKAAVVLGNTWQVSGVVIAGVLAMVLAANAVTAAVPRLPVGLAYAALLASCLGLYAVDLASLAFLPYPAKAAAVGLLTALPMLFSGVVFARAFVAAGRKDLALGANLFGALVGGLLQPLTFVTGINALLLVVAGLYAAAFLTRPAAGDPGDPGDRPAADPGERPA